MNSVKQHGKSFDWLKAYKWQKGQSGNPKGRPKTKTLKEHARTFLANLSEADRINYFSSLDPEIVWRMAEGNPKQDTDLTSAGKPILQIAPEIAAKNALNTSTEPNSEGHS